MIFDLIFVILYQILVSLYVAVRNGENRLMLFDSEHGGCTSCTHEVEPSVWLYGELHAVFVLYGLYQLFLAQVAVGLRNV